MHLLAPSYDPPQLPASYDLLPHDAVLPPQLGIVTFGLSTLFESISPHCVSHCCVGVLYVYFQGSSKISNLSLVSIVSKQLQSFAHQKYSVPFAND